MDELPFGKRTRLQNLALVFMVPSTLWLLGLATYAMKNSLNQREAGYLAGISLILIAELVYLYISAFTNRVTWLIDTKGRKVGVVYDEADLILEMAEIVGVENMTITRSADDEAQPEGG